MGWHQRNPNYQPLAANCQAFVHALVRQFTGVRLQTQAQSAAALVFLGNVAGSFGAAAWLIAPATVAGGIATYVLGSVLVAPITLITMARWMSKIERAHAEVPLNEQEARRIREREAHAAERRPALWRGRRRAQA